MTAVVQRIWHASQRVTRKAERRLSNALNGLYDARPPDPTRQAAMHLVREMRSLLILYNDGLQGRGTLWEGEEIDSGQPMRVAYLADERARHVLTPEYLCHILFVPGSVREQELCAFPMWRSRSLAERIAGTVDLVIVEQNPLLNWQPCSGRFFVSPPWVRMAFLLQPGEPWEAAEARMHSQKSNIKLARRNGFVPRISSNEADFDLFYDRMYLPMLRERHPSYGWVEHKESMRDMFRRGVLLLIDGPDGRPVCGQLGVVHNNVLFAVINGTLDGDKRWHDLGALSALYYHSIRWCYDNGLVSCDFGECRPFQTDGLYNYKVRWGMTTTPNPWTSREWLFWSLRPDSPGVGWLERHPLVKE